ncbi:phospholipase carboxylesterase, partial [Cystoisospora suis]
MCSSSLLREFFFSSIFSGKASSFLSVVSPFFSPPSFLPLYRCLNSTRTPEKKRENSPLCRGSLSSSFSFLLPSCMDHLSYGPQPSSSSLSLFLGSPKYLSSSSGLGDSSWRSLHRPFSQGNLSLSFLLAAFFLLPSSSCSLTPPASFSLSSPVLNGSFQESLVPTCEEKPLSLSPSFLSFSCLSSPPIFSPSPPSRLSSLRYHFAPSLRLSHPSPSNRHLSSSSSHFASPSSSLFFSSSLLSSRHISSRLSPSTFRSSFLSSNSYYFSRRPFSFSSLSSSSFSKEPSSSSFPTSSSPQPSSFSRHPSSVSFSSSPPSSTSSLPSSSSLPPPSLRMASPPATFQRGDGHGGEGLHIFPPSSSSSRDPCLSTVIFLHGLGDTAAGWRDVLPLLSTLPCFMSLRIILPTAPIRPISLNGGMPMPAWGDIFALTRDAPEDRTSYLQTKERIDEILRKEVEEAGVPPERILLGGFSQGGAMAYLVGLQSKYRLGGIIALSTWLPLSS